jgi:hypothetical protein
MSRPRPASPLRGILTSLLIGLLATACSDRPPAPAATLAPPTPVDRILTLARLENIAYQGVELPGVTPPVQLQDGRYRAAALADGGPPAALVLGKTVAYGDLDGDGAEEAAVTLAAEPGAGEPVRYLAVVAVRAGAPENIATTQLGERVQVETVQIMGEQIEVIVWAFAPSDGPCCPSLRLTRVYRLQEGQLVLHGETAR